MKAVQVVEYGDVDQLQVVHIPNRHRKLEWC